MQPSGVANMKGVQVSVNSNHEEFDSMAYVAMMDKAAFRIHVRAPVQKWSEMQPDQHKMFH